MLHPWFCKLNLCDSHLFGPQARCQKPRKGQEHAGRHLTRRACNHSPPAGHRREVDRAASRDRTPGSHTGLIRVSYGSHTSKRQISISRSTDLVSQPLNFAGQAIVHIVCFGLLLFCFVWILVDQRKDRLIFWLIREYQDTNTPLVNDFSKKTGSKREHQVGCHRVLLYV